VYEESSLYLRENTLSLLLLEAETYIFPRAESVTRIGFGKTWTQSICTVVYSSEVCRRIQLVAAANINRERG
jgi:hypothetical protein